LASIGFTPLSSLIHAGSEADLQFTLRRYFALSERANVEAGSRQ